MRTLVLGLAALVAPGCITYATEFDGNPVTDAMAEFPKIGETTKQQVLERLGSPQSIRLSSLSGLAESLMTRARADRLTVNLDTAIQDEIYTWERSATTYFAFITLFFNYYTSDKRIDRLVVVFDKDDKVLAVGYTPGASAPSGG